MKGCDDGVTGPTAPYAEPCCGMQPSLVQLCPCPSLACANLREIGGKSGAYSLRGGPEVRSVLKNGTTAGARHAALLELYWSTSRRSWSVELSAAARPCACPAPLQQPGS